MDENQLKYYGIYSEKIMQCKNIMLDEINTILTTIYNESDYRPAEHVLARIKSTESLIEKQKRMGLDEGARAGIIGLSDIIGCRIVTHFVGDIYCILDELKKSDKWQIKKVKDYIKNSKPNGYRSLHVILKMPFEVDNISTILTEIQLRTIAMDCWAALEHQLKYKKQINNVELITSELKRCADEIASTDLSMQTLRDLIRSGN